jgi:hypothetical protein
MRRYGDNITPDDAPEEQPNNKRDQFATVFFGGCGARFGAFHPRVEVPKKRPPLHLLSFLRLKRKQAKED